MEKRKKLIVLITLIISITFISGCGFSSFDRCFEKCTEVNDCGIENRITWKVICPDEIDTDYIDEKCYDECKGS